MRYLAKLFGKKECTQIFGDIEVTQFRLFGKLYFLETKA